jgi:hypothetical protein
VPAKRFLRGLAEAWPRLAAILSVLVVSLAFVAACGGNDDDDPLLPGADSTGDDGADDGNGGGDSLTGTGTGTFTLGDDTFDVTFANTTLAGAEQPGRCFVLQGALDAVGYVETSDGGYLTVDLRLPPPGAEGVEPPTIAFFFHDAAGEQGARFIADEDSRLYDQGSGQVGQVDDYTLDLDALSAEGSATYTDDGTTETPGTFSLQCE